MTPPTHMRSLSTRGHWVNVRHVCGGGWGVGCRRSPKREWGHWLSKGIGTHSSCLWGEGTAVSPSNLTSLIIWGHRCASVTSVTGGWRSFPINVRSLITWVHRYASVTSVTGGCRPLPQTWGHSLSEVIRTRPPHTWWGKWRSLPSNLRSLSTWSNRVRVRHVCDGGPCPLHIYVRP